MARKSKAGKRSGKSSLAVRSLRFGWKHGSLVLLGFAALAPVFGVFGLFGGEASWSVALSWFALHAILAAYVQLQNRPLPRFHAAGFGKPSDPGARDSSYELEHPPIRGKWEVAVFVVFGWFVVGIVSSLPGAPMLIGSIYVCVVGLTATLLAVLYDRRSASEARRLMRAKPIDVGAASSGKRPAGWLVGTVLGERSDKPLMWREVLHYSWSESQQVTKNITDSDGNSRTIQTTETKHYRCGMRHQQHSCQLRLETSDGQVDVSFAGVTWAATRELSFGRGGGDSDQWRPAKKQGAATKDRTQAAARERIYAGDQLVVVGELRRDGGEGPRVVGGEGGRALLFSAGPAAPRAALRLLLLRRRALLVLMVALGLSSFASSI